MGKQGPCYHCGVTSTPLWRNGPPEKPVLCNACGSRWRTKGTLANYTPLHARADLVDYEDQKPPRVKSISINKNKEVKLLKRKQNYDSMASGGVAYDYNHCFQKVVDEDMSNRSSSGSAISNSDAQFGSADASDLTGPAQSVVWDTMVPSRKRTCVNRPKQSSVEQLTKDLHAIMHEQQTSCFSRSSEEDLLLESATPMCSFEIGNGTVLFRDPSVITREEESEASSLSVDRQQYKTNEVYSCTPSLALHKGGKSISFLRPTSRTEKIRKSAEQVVGHEKLKRDNLQHEKLQILGNHNSPLRSINLQDVVNFEEFMQHLTDQEQQHLLKYLPSVDTTELPDSLENLFDSSEFKENLSAFQQLLADGVFDNSFSGAKAEDCKTLKGLALSNLMKSKWVECHRQLQESKTRSGGSANTGPQAMVLNKLAGGRRLRDVQNQNFPDARAMLMSPKRTNMKGSSENKEYMENDGSCFSPRSLFALPHDGSTFLLESPFMDDNSEQDLLVDVPSSGFFPQAELLIPTQSFGSLQASTSSSSVSPHPLHPR